MHQNTSEWFLNTFKSMLDVFAMSLGHFAAFKRPVTARNGHKSPYVTQCRNGVGKRQNLDTRLDTLRTPGHRHPVSGVVQLCPQDHFSLTIEDYTRLSTSYLHRHNGCFNQDLDIKI